MSVLICGGSRGIGRAIGEGLAQPGTHVFLNYLGAQDEADDAARAVKAAGAEVTLIYGDISTPSGANEVLETVRSQTDHLGALVHCAVKTVSGPVLTADPVAFGSAVQVNAMSLMYVVQAALPLLGKGSSVVYLTSRGSRLALKDYASVGVPKAMGEAFIRYLAVELAPLGARANAVSPTAQDTEAFRSVFPDDYEERLRQAAQRSPAGRAVDLDDIVDVVRFLVSPGAEMLQGQTIILDGASTLVG